MSTQQFSNRTPPAESATLTRSIMCHTCHAVYSPAQDHLYLNQAPSSSLEAAFMSMCHFCFRCRRPSCPACWDHVHGVCAACVQEMRLPFREELSPLRGTFFPPMRHAQETRIHTSTTPLDCIQPGQFDDRHPIENASTGPVKIVTAILPQSPPIPSEHYPASSTQPDPDIDKLKTTPDRSKRGKHIERVVTIVFLVVLLIVVALMITASLSVSANTFIATVLHIDIRAELAYLWQIITHLFS
jgi:hypothetical protein